jgi:hypothetical protein
MDQDVPTRPAIKKATMEIFPLVWPKGREVDLSAEWGYATDWKTWFSKDFINVPIVH